MASSQFLRLSSASPFLKFSSAVVAKVGPPAPKKLKPAHPAEAKSARPSMTAARAAGGLRGQGGRERSLSGAASSAAQRAAPRDGAGPVVSRKIAWSATSTARLPWGVPCGWQVRYEVLQ